MLQRTALYAALLGVAVVALGLAGAYFKLLPPYTAFRLFGAGLLVGGLLSLGLGVVALLRSRGSDGGAWAAALIGVALLGTLVTLALPGVGKPPIHDLTTDPDDAPTFAQAPGRAGEPYPHGGPEVAAQQRRAYPGLATVELELPMDEAFAAARQTAEELGWTISWASAAEGRIEAYDTSRLFGFVDDVAIRVRAAGGAAGSDAASEVDLRSISRVGVSDLGVNAARIERFVQTLRGRVGTD